MVYDIAAPEPSGMVASLSSLGYSLPAAVADLVDNSISAGASSIDVEFTWAGRDSWVAVVDNGTGMTTDELVTAMTVAARGPAIVRSPTDLGRFGVGLKSASFSQARQLTVATAKTGDWSVRTWDLDVIEETGEWRLLRDADDSTTRILDALRGAAGQGTVVLWRRLTGYYYSDTVTEGDERTQKQFYAEAARTESHLGMVFARFLTGNSRCMRVLGTPVEPWDPFLSRHPSVQRLPVEQLRLGTGTVRVEAFVLPSAHRLPPTEYEKAGGPRGWLDQQGFYVYRRDRLILAGDWLGQRGLRREEKYNLARIAVDIPAETDVEWGVDVRKSSVVPPVGLRPHIRRIARQARRLASDVLRHRGQIAARTHGEPLRYAWHVRRDKDQVTCKINREHPLVRAALRSDGGSPGDVRALLRLLEETVPVTALRVMHETDTSDDPEPFGGAGPADPDATEVAQRIYEAMVTGGRSPAAARERLRTMHPFDQLQGFWNR
ncbi:histidine kinase/DNA gyrase B/HSP90-like ATPase [Streptomyces sp. Amel2xB2]|uniref:ATP-binding protein n=1 Tax=Streptomyces sp. Amel2xB2 TaxID=1305829 RepID=UPI000DB927CB|nr:ATP-binding protein [Streptomyces sp. Amel2xB2]RAJ61668.1 histidine kinase/DNA gyrase B/HSP90-like ATPase [Streptomyces sp. Amel2xB2]